MRDPKTDGGELPSREWMEWERTLVVPDFIKNYKPKQSVCLACGKPVPLGLPCPCWEVEG